MSTGTHASLSLHATSASEQSRRTCSASALQGHPGVQPPILRGCCCHCSLVPTIRRVQSGRGQHPNCGALCGGAAAVFRGATRQQRPQQPARSAWRRSGGHCAARSRLPVGIPRSPGLSWEASCRQLTTHPDSAPTGFRCWRWLLKPPPRQSPASSSSSGAPLPPPAPSAPCCCATATGISTLRGGSAARRSTSTASWLSL